MMMKVIYTSQPQINENFGCHKNIPFAGISVLVCGDLFQLLPVNPPGVHCQINHIRV